MAATAFAAPVPLVPAPNAAAAPASAAASAATRRQQPQPSPAHAPAPVRMYAAPPAAPAPLPAPSPARARRARSSGGDGGGGGGSSSCCRAAAVAGASRASGCGLRPPRSPADWLAEQRAVAAGVGPAARAALGARMRVARRGTRCRTTVARPPPCSPVEAAEDGDDDGDDGDAEHTGQAPEAPQGVGAAGHAGPSITASSGAATVEPIFASGGAVVAFQGSEEQQVESLHEHDCTADPRVSDKDDMEEEGENVCPKSPAKMLAEAVLGPRMMFSAPWSSSSSSPSPPKTLAASFQVSSPASSNNSLATATAAAAAATAAAASPLFTMSSAATWLYRPPPPYCPIHVPLDEDHMAVLDGRIDYLGPVNRNKVVRAIEMARTHAMPLLTAQNVAVAAIVADLQMDVETVCAAILRGLLHDPSEIARNLGADVATILKLHTGVTRVVDVAHSGDSDHQFSEADYTTLRELILVSAVDHRAISLELASAVVATRSLDSLPANHDKLACARRAMHLYAPLANQLGIWFIQSELEELAFMHLHPQSFQTIRAELAHRMRESQRVLEDKKLIVERALSTTPAVRRAVRSVQIKGRIKGTYSCYRKIVRKGKSLSDIYDLLALRIIVQARAPDDSSQAEACYAVADAVLKCLPTVPARAKDYVAKPKPNGYRSVHLTVAPTEDSPTPLEIQIRTEKMHYVAEFGAAAHWVYKQTNAPDVKAAIVPSADLTSGVASGMVNRRGLGNESMMASKIGSESVFHVSGRSQADAGLSATKRGSSADQDSDDDHANGPGLTVTVSGETEVVDPLLEVNQQFVTERDSDCERSVTDRRRIGEYELCNRRRGGYMNALVSAIIASRVIVLSCGHLYRLTVGSTLQDLACKMGVASRGMIALVNGIPVPLSHRLQMSDSVRWL